MDKNLVLVILVVVVYVAYRYIFHNKSSRQEMVNLWVDHLLYTRLVMMAYFRDSPELNVTKDRLLQNQRDIGALWGRQYGKENGDALTSLLLEHITIAIMILVAIKTKNDGEKTKQINEFYRNAEEIGKLIDRVTHRTNIATGMMKEHIDTLVADVVSFVTGDWVNDVKNLDRYIKAGIHMGFMF